MTAAEHPGSGTSMQVKASIVGKTVVVLLAIVGALGLTGRADISIADPRDASTVVQQVDAPTGDDGDGDGEEPAKKRKAKEAPGKG